MSVPLHPHGAARVAAKLGPVDELAPALSDAMREQLAKAELSEEDAHLAWELARLCWRHEPGGASPPTEERADVRSPSLWEGLGEGLRSAGDPLPPPLPEGGGPSPCSSEVSPEKGADPLLGERLSGEGLTPLDHQALITLILLVTEAQARGSTRVRIDEPARLVDRARLLGATPELAERVPMVLARAAEPPLDVLFGAPGSDRPLCLDGPHLYTGRMHALEGRLTRAIAARARPSVASPALDAALDRLRAAPARTAHGALTLTAEQESAVRLASSAPISVISGGPGTGKTSIVVSILRAALASGAIESPIAIALAAPTGKAADRMRRAIEQSLRSIASPEPFDRRLLEELPAPRTLHRLLGFSPNRGAFRHHADAPLSERLVVVDESSMIDVLLMERLLAALRPDARLVVLGDAEQLPSVAAGAVFRDLGRAPSVPSVTLTESHRMDPRVPSGFNVLSVAQHINRGTSPRLVALSDAMLPSDLEAIGRLDAMPSSLEALGGVCLYEPASAAARESFLDTWLDERVIGDEATRRLATRTWTIEGGRVVDGAALAPLFAFSERARLVCVTRSAFRSTGVDAINASLHQRLAEHRRQSPAPGHLLAGEPVLVHRNDYERGLFNGDQGIVLWTRATADDERGDDAGPARLALVVRADDGFAAHPLDAVRASIDLGFATTVHKAQGSEHDQVALLLPETDSPRLLTREIVYTAVTRARRSVLVIGARAMLERAIQRRVERSSGITERLASEPTGA